MSLVYVLRSSVDLIKENDFTLKKSHVANTPIKAKSLLQRLEQAAAVTGIGLHVNANKTVHVFRREEAISTSNGGPLKFVNQFTYHSSNISCTECDANIGRAKA